jgi:hypothetical protein
MKTKYNNLYKLLTTIAFGLIYSFSSLAQPYPFVLSPTGTSTNFMKFLPKQFTFNGTNYATGYLTLSAYQNITTQVFTDPGIPLQKLQLQGGNILLCRTNSAAITPDINPTSRNGAILFSDNVIESSGFIHGKWGIEYDDQYSTGGLNFFKPKSSLTSSRINYNFFIRNDGNVGIGTGTPATKLHVVGEATVTALANTGEDIVTTDVTGKLILIPKKLVGDNMGTCEAGFTLKMFDHAIQNGTAGDKIFTRPDGTTTELGLHFDRSNNMILEPGISNAKFTILSCSGSSTSMWVSNYSSGGYGLALNPDNLSGGIYYDANAPKLVMGFNNLKVGIGLKPPSDGAYMLYVAGGILATEVRVQLQSDWKDLVFKPEYKLRSLTEVETFISKNGHLPEIPTSETVQKEGINIGDMNALLLQKIEELTLYILQQQKQIDTQQSEINSIKSNLNR